MEYWGKMANVTAAAGAQQVRIYSSFPGSKPMEITASFFNFGGWVRETYYSTFVCTRVRA